MLDIFYVISKCRLALVVNLDGVKCTLVIFLVHIQFSGMEKKI